MAYTAWAGGSAALTALVGIVWFGETFSLINAIGIGTAISGIVLLNLGGTTSTY